MVYQNPSSSSDRAASGQSPSNPLKDKVREKANQVASQVQQRVGEMVDERRSYLADEVGTVAHAVREGGRKLHEEHEDRIAPYVDRAAEQIEHLAGYLRQATPKQMVRDVALFARQRPELFIGGAVFLGFALARFLKSSAEEADIAAREAQVGYEYGSLGEELPADINQAPAPSAGMTPSMPPGPSSSPSPQGQTPSDLGYPTQDNL